MVEKDTIIKEKLWYVGITDFKDFYNFAYEWLREEDFNITEDKYKEVVKGDAKEIEVKWIATKKITDYFRISIDLAWKVLGMVDVEVEIDGKKKKMNKVAELSITIKGVLDKDYNSKWEANTVHKFMKETYHKFIIPGRTEQMEEKVVEYIKLFHSEMKAFLDLTGRK